MANKRKRASKEGPSDVHPTQKRSKSETPATTNGASSSSSAKSKTTSKAVTVDKTLFTETPSREDRAREADLYDKLGREDADERIEAADVIISSLLGSGSEEVAAEPILRRHLEKRLFRGLASGRNASRLGFSLVITEILNQLFGKKNLAGTKYTGMTFEEVRRMLLRSTTPIGMNGQEERNHYFGQLFGIECFVRAGIVAEDKEKWFVVLDLLFELSQKKSWLKPQCGFITVQAVSQMKQKLAEETLQKLADQGFAKSPEGVAIWIAALDRFPDMKVPAQPWKHPLAASSLSALPAALKDSGREQSNEEVGGKKPKQGNWTAQLHFVWDLILAHFAKLGSKSEDDASEQFKQFWSRVVDEGFFSKNASDSQKFSGFMIFQKMLEGAASCRFIVKTLFSKNLMVCLMNQAAKEDRYLHRAAIKALKAIEVAVQNNPDFLPVILKELFGKHGAYNFDQRTNTKTVDKLLQNTNPETIKAVLKALQPKDISKSGLDEEKYYQSLGNYLFRLASIQSEGSDADGAGKSVPGAAIKVLTELAYSNKSVPESIKENLRTRSTSAFAKLVRRPEDFGFLCEAILSIETDVDPDDEVAGAVLPQAFERLKDLLDPSKATKATRESRQALALLHAVGVLQFYNQEPDIMDIFEELEECYEKLAKEGGGAEEGASEFLVESLLAMIARPSSLMRQVSQQVFEAFTGLLSAEALKLLTDPLAVEENDKGRQTLFSTEDEDMMDVDGEDDASGSDEEEELDSDVEIVDLEDAGSDVPDGDEEEDGEEEDGEEEDGEEEDDEKEDDGEEDRDEALLKALSEALGPRALNQDGEDSDAASDVSDSEMLAGDANLAQIFKLRAKPTSKKQQKKDAKETVVNFKHRVLDLLAIFVKKESSNGNPLTFDVLLPLLHLIRTTTVKPLANKAHEVISNFSKGLKKARSSSSSSSSSGSGEAADAAGDAESLLAMLIDLHEEASKDPSHAFAKAVSTASLAVAAVLCSEKLDKTDEVFQLYAKTQFKWFRGQVKIQQAFFSDWLNWCQSHASAAAAAAAQEQKEK
ncbi:DNA polymerase V [Cladorrhinum sp. PSN332]|nr:DNA polymerase V [Cladorrhinum sp. PSN332]